MQCQQKRGEGFQEEGDGLKSACAVGEVGKHRTLPTGQPREGDLPPVSAASPTETPTPTPSLVRQAHLPITSANWTTGAARTQETAQFLENEAHLKIL